MHHKHLFILIEESFRSTTGSYRTVETDNGLSTPAQSTLTPAQESESNMELLEYIAPHNAPPSVSRF